MNKKIPLLSILGAASIGSASAGYIPIDNTQAKPPMQETATQDIVGSAEDRYRLAFDFNGALVANGLDPAGSYTVNLVSGNDLLAATELSGASAQFPLTALKDVYTGQEMANSPEILDATNSIAIYLTDNANDNAYNIGNFSVSGNAGTDTFTLPAENGLVYITADDTATATFTHKNVEGASLETLAGDGKNSLIMEGTNGVFPVAYFGDDGNTYLNQNNVLLGTDLETWADPSTYSVSINQENGYNIAELAQSGEPSLYIGFNTAVAPTKVEDLK